MEEQLRSAGMPLAALESGKPLKEFDLVGFTLQYELSYTNILNMLDLAGIPRLAAERSENAPLIMAGGPCAYNVEPLADFLDFVVLGEGEEVIHEIIHEVHTAKDRELSEKRYWSALPKFPECMSPVFTKRVREDGSFAGISPVKPGVPEKVTKRVVKDLSQTEYPKEFVVPYVDVVHDRVMVEVLRAVLGCRFCQAG